MAASPGGSPPPSLDLLAPLPAHTQLPPDYGPRTLAIVAAPPPSFRPHPSKPVEGLARKVESQRRGWAGDVRPGTGGAENGYAELEQFARPPGGGGAGTRREQRGDAGHASRGSSPLTDLDELEAHTNAEAGSSNGHARPGQAINAMAGYALQTTQFASKPRKDTPPEDLAFTTKRRMRTQAEKDAEAAAKAARLAEREAKRAAKQADQAEVAKRRVAREAKSASSKLAKEEQKEMKREAKEAAGTAGSSGRGCEADGDGENGDDNNRSAPREPGRELQSPFAVADSPAERKPGRKAPKKRVAVADSEGGGSPVKRTRTAKSAAKPKVGPRKAVEKAIALSLRTGKYYNSPRDHKGKAGALTEADIKTLLLGKTVEVQLATCLRARYADYSRCFHCVKKTGTDACRFRYFRCFPIDPDTAAITGEPFFQSRIEAEDMPALVTGYNRDPEAGDRQRIKSCVAPALLPVITRQLQHVVSTKALTRPLPMNDRALCDFCSVTIFGGSFFCKCCGREYCLSCNDYMPSSVDSMRDSPLPLDDAARPRLMLCFYNRKHAQPDMMPISRFTEAALRRHWLALTKYCREDEQALLSNAAELPADSAIHSATLPDAQATKLQQYESRPLAVLERHRREDLERRARELGQRFYSRKTRSLEMHGLEQPVDPAGVQCHPFLFIKGDELKPDVFDALWTRGEPIVVDGLQRRFNETWDPETFIDRSGEETCNVSDCQSHLSHSLTVAQFFSRFGEAKKLRQRRTWKLKDWPTDNEFKSKFPDLFEDFSQSLPAPDFTRRNGALNISSFFPTLDSRPDIGPKMYNAFAGVELGGKHRGLGTTRLHMDMADAINMMTFAQPLAETADAEAQKPGPAEPAAEANGIPSPKPMADPAEADVSKGSSKSPQVAATAVVDSVTRDPFADIEMSGPQEDGKAAGQSGSQSPNGVTSVKEGPQVTRWKRVQPAPTSNGCAVWDIFRAEDSNAIRDYLREKWSHREKFSDPIHSQIFYLNSDHRQELFEKKGVFAHRIYQYPGQAVLIPAGCAHQVCNLADCIKIACDFVSPHNVERCLQLAKEFRSENTIHFSWKDDVLQFNNTLWFAWLACNTLDKLSQSPSPAADAVERRNGHRPNLEEKDKDKTMEDLVPQRRPEMHDDHAALDAVPKGPVGTPQRQNPYSPLLEQPGIKTHKEGLDSVMRDGADSPNPLELLANQAQKQERLAASPAPPLATASESAPETVAAAATAAAFPPSQAAPRLREPSDADIADGTTRRLLDDLLAQTPAPAKGPCPGKVMQPQEFTKAREAVKQVAGGGTLRTVTTASAATAAAASGGDGPRNGTKEDARAPAQAGLNGLVRMASPSPGSAENRANDTADDASLGMDVDKKEEYTREAPVDATSTRSRNNEDADLSNAVL